MNFTRYNADGSIDNNFGINGVVNLPYPYSDFSNFFAGIAQPDDKMVFMINNFLCRFNTDGSLDNSFNINYLPYITSLPSSWYPYPVKSKIILHANSKFSILCNRADQNVVVSPNSTWALGVHTNLLRINNDGTTDTTFGKKGVIDFPSFKCDYNNVWANYDALDRYFGFARQANGDYVIGGFRQFSPVTNTDSGIVARLNGREFYNNIVGKTFTDKNLNGIQDTSENKILRYPTVYSIIKPGVDTASVFTMGNLFMVDVDTGSYTTKVIPSNPYYNIVPASKTTSHSTYFNTDTVVFGMQPIPGKRDIGISLTSFQPHGGILRPLASYQITYQNLGTDTVAGTIRFIKDSNLAYSGSNVTPTSVNADTIIWNFTNLQLQEVRTINLGLLIGNNVNIGDTLCAKATIYPFANDLDTSNNYSETCGIFSSGYEPNDKTEAHGG